jgi:carbonic anhydrase/acetyltransferase-like protein (isoleucine patch superfamily)
MTHDESPGISRRDLFKVSLGSAAALTLTASAASLGGCDKGDPSGTPDGASTDAAVPPGPGTPGPVGFTGFIHPTARLATTSFSIGPASLIEGFVSLEGDSARIGAASNLQDNDRLLPFDGPGGRTPGDLQMGDGTFTAHGVTFIGRVRIGDACGTVINATLQNARIGNASIVGFLARILGTDPNQLIEIPDATLVLFGARIASQADVAANTIPVPAPFSLFASDVDQENLLLARGYNLLYRAAARMTPFSSAANDPRNPGQNFPDLASAFGKLSVAPPTLDRRGTGVIPARQASLGDLDFNLYQPLAPVPRPSTPAPDSGGATASAPSSTSPEAGARFIIPRVVDPQLVSNNAIVLGGCDLAAGVVIGDGSYLHGGDAPAISVGAGTRIGQNTSLHQLTFTSCRVGSNCTIGNRVVLHGPLEIGDNVTIGDGAVLFGPTVQSGVTIGAGSLVFGPVTVTQDLPPRTFMVAPGNEGLIAPTATQARATGRPSRIMFGEWRRGLDAGARCGCGAGMALLALG